MITSLILNAFYGLIWLVLAPIRALPNASLPEGLADALSSAGQYVSPLNTVVPVPTITAVVVALVSIEGFMLLWKGINWILRRIPTQS